MAVEIKFLDAIDQTDFIRVSKQSIFRSPKEYICIQSVNDTESISIWLDKSTAIKLKKRIATLINEITVEEAKNA